MLTSRELLAAVRAAQDIPSNYRLARVLDVPEQSVQRWNSGKHTPDDETAARLPRHPPTWPMIIADIGTPSAVALGRALGVSPRTIERWHAAGVAPRAAALALFPLTRWAAGQVESGAVRRLQLSESLVLTLRVDLLAARREIARLERVGDFGAANGPRYGRA